MKIKKSELIELIKEEAQRINKIRSLSVEKAHLEKQLQECMDMEEMVDEGLFGPNEEQIKQGYLNTIKAWTAKGYTAPNFEEIMAQAKADKFAGKLGTDPTTKAIIYRPATAIKWQGPVGHNFGGGAE